MNRKKILIINREQFGYHTDTYYYCKYLSSIFDITYLCFDMGRKKEKEDGTKVIYASYCGGFLSRGYRFIALIYKCIKNNDYDLIFCDYFKMISILKLIFYKHNIILDIRTSSISVNKYHNSVINLLIRIESMLFRDITIVSDCLMDKLGLNKDKCHVLPLGYERLSKERKNYSKIKLLYVGTFYSRNINETVIGLGLFKQKNDSKIDISYDIIGFGSEEEKHSIYQAIKKYDLLTEVKIYDWKSHKELEPFFDKCNLGVCYVPINSCFNCQPSTKIFEYIGSGMVCIATKTNENEKLISEDNGILCEDNPESFASAIEFYCRRFSLYDYEKITKSLSSNKWTYIINNNLYPYFQKKMK